MDDQELRDLLQQLQDEIKNTLTVDETGSEMLRDLDSDIHALLERSEEQPIQIQPSIAQRLDDTIRHFEVTYPDLTTLISKLMEALSNAGI